MEGTREKTLVMLTGKNWAAWRFQMSIILKSKKLYGVVSGTEEFNAEASEKEQNVWIDNDCKAQEVIVTHIDEQVLSYLTSCETSKSMWEKLTTLYEPSAQVGVHLVQQRFFNLSFEEPVMRFISKIEEISSQLRALNEEPTEKMIITKILMTLPAKYKHFASAWESVPAASQNLKELTSRLLVEEERSQERSSGPAASGAFVSKSNKSVQRVWFEKEKEVETYRDVIFIEHARNDKEEVCGTNKDKVTEVESEVGESQEKVVEDEDKLIEDEEEMIEVCDEMAEENHERTEHEGDMTEEVDKIQEKDKEVIEEEDRRNSTTRDDNFQEEYLEDEWLSADEARSEEEKSERGLGKRILMKPKRMDNYEGPSATHRMSQNCKATFTAATVRDANNNTLYHTGGTPAYGARYSPNVAATGNYQVRNTMFTAATVRDANNNTLYHTGTPAYGASKEHHVYNNNTLYHSGGTPAYGARYSPNVAATGNYQQVTAKVLFGSVAAINDLGYKRVEKPEREARRTH
ncbi:gag-polypeptide of LTR copia-type domain-containing protein [Phthorimaea operculella]|nr:gag-polypeptide of LTR copia-type domain-containing protein [Phthorimaea operculella]